MNGLERRQVWLTSSWLISTIAHLSFALVVALLLRPAGKANSAAGTLIISFATADPVEMEVATFTASPWESPAEKGLQASAEWLDPGELAGESILEVASPLGTQRRGTPRRAGATASTAKSPNRREESEGGTPGASAEFFGTVAVGDRFAYLLDYSRSMDGKRDEEGRTRFHRARDELIRSIEQLSERQKLCVFLFSGQTRPMLDEPELLSEYLPATQENKRRIKDWLHTIVTGSGTDPNEALSRSLALAPHAVFLLSDGEFNVDRPAQIGVLSRRVGESRGQIIEQAGESRVPIHTIAFEDEAGAKNMKLLSSVTAGHYRFVEPSPEAERNAQLEAGGRPPRPAPTLRIATSQPTKERLAEKSLLVGKAHESLGHPDKAKECYRKIVSRYPATAGAKEAAARLERLTLESADPSIKAH